MNKNSAEQILQPCSANTQLILAETSTDGNALPWGSRITKCLLAAARISLKIIVN